MTGWLEKQFKLSERRTDIRTEITAGLTTFMTMGYIIFVNPDILSQIGMPFGAVMVSTCLAAAFATLVMAFMANYPLVLASAMGLNAFFAFTVVATMGIPWQVALAAVFVEGIIFILLTLTKLRESVVNGIPQSLKHAITAGIGMFIAFIGFKSGGLVAADAATFVKQAPLAGNMPAILTLVGLVIMVAFQTFKIRGAILWGILITTVLAMCAGVASWPTAIVSMPPSIEPILMKLDFSYTGLDFWNAEGFKFWTLFKNPAVINFWIVVFTFFFVDFFDTAGMLVGVSCRAGLLDEKGCLPGARQALLADAIGTTAGAVLGVSTVTTYVESVAGIEVGGRTGLAALVAALLFLVAIFFSPLVRVVPACATAPALIFVGIFMLGNIVEINYKDWTEVTPALLAVMTMPFTYSIASGIEVGIVSYAAIKLITGRLKEVTPIIWFIAIVFILKEMLI